MKLPHTKDLKFQPIYRDLFEVRFSNSSLANIVCEQLVSIRETAENGYKSLIIKFSANLDEEKRIVPRKFIEDLMSSPVLVTLECFNRQGENYMRKEYHHSTVHSVEGLELWSYEISDPVQLRVEMKFVDSRTVFYE